MTACSTCGKCPCYEHERKTVMVDPKPRQPGGRHSEAHAKAIAELRECWASGEYVSNGVHADGDRAKQYIFRSALDYADSLAAQLEAERALTSLLKEQLAYDQEERKAAEEKLRAAEGVVEAARLVDCGLHDALTEALSAYDAINPDGSTGDPNPSK